MNYTGRQFFDGTFNPAAADVKYHGLAKEGATCYLNSVLQVLFMTKDFREAVIRHTNENSQFIDQHLKALFEDLQNHTAKTDAIIKKLGIDNVYEQHDAAEYFEKILTLTSPQASQIFHGMLAKKTACCTCLTQTDIDIPFWHLPLALVDSCTDTKGSEGYRVVDGIGEFFRMTELNGENQMYCDQCDGKVDATTNDGMKNHPDVLLLLLKRFEFSYHDMSYVKINCAVEVPYTLQIPDSQTYELYAVVDHVGDLRSGLYSARIKIEEEHGDRWYNFDDAGVTELDYQPFQVDNTEKSESAYLLFYRKKKNAVGEEVKEMEQLSLTADQKSHTDCEGSEVSDDSRKDTRECGEGRQIVGKDYSSKFVRFEADKVTTGERKLLTRYDLLNESQDEQTGSERIQIIPKDNQMNEQRSISRFLNEPIEEDVMGEVSNHYVTHLAHKDVSVQTQRRSVRDDREETKEMSEITTENPDNSEAVKHEVSMRLDGKGQKTAEKIISVTRTSQSVGGVQIQSKGQKNEYDTKLNQSEGNKITKERQTEKQEVGSNENIEIVRLECFQPKARIGAQGLAGGGCGSMNSSPIVRVIDEEHTEIDSACKDDSQTKIIIKKTMDETTQDMTKWLEKQRNIRRSLHLEIDKEVTLDKMLTL
ncbi:ubiquitin carboxyl-terminal hydrolase 17-like protein B isoform X1 [Oreochromis niloticus]|uniref:Ubiquitin carboxyl-terminal hydrolase 19 n=1 Tax=Oreochromis niloticus TaxID=8128 RepID=A0A669BFA1_ORENI|nr:ubiquitin carboxyl-terminal hydrolase 17-like protein B isoform X1 [Oreochromis niloticus]